MKQRRRAGGGPPPQQRDVFLEQRAVTLIPLSRRCPIWVFRGGFVVEEAGPDAVEEAALEIALDQLRCELCVVRVHQQAVRLLATEGAAEVHGGVGVGLAFAVAQPVDLGAEHVEQRGGEGELPGGGGCEPALARTGGAPGGEG